MLLEQQVSGVVFAGGHYAEADAPHEHYLRLLERGCPWCWSTPPSSTSDFPRSPPTTRSPSSRRSGTWLRWATSGSG